MALESSKGGIGSLQRLIVLLVCLFLAASLLPPGSAQTTVENPSTSIPPLPPIPSVPSPTFGCEVSLDPQRCLVISDFSVTGHTDPDSGKGDFFLRSIVTNDGPTSRMVWVEFQALWTQPDGNQTRVEINQGYHKIPAEGMVIIATDWTADLPEQDGNLSFHVRAQLLTPYGMTNNWKTEETIDWHEASFSLKSAWIATESLEANTTALLATAELAHLRGGASPVNLSLVDSNNDWIFTAETEENVLGENENTSVQVHVRPPANAKERDGAEVVLMVEDPEVPTNVPVFLQFETPPVNSSSPNPDASVNETVDAGKSWAEGTGQKQWAVVIGMTEEHYNQNQALVVGSLPNEEPSVPDEPDLPGAPDTPAAPPNPQENSGEDWVWYLVDAAEWGYETAARHWPNDPFQIGGSVGGGRDVPKFPEFHDLKYGPNEPLPPSPFDSIASVVGTAGPSQPSQVGPRTAQGDHLFSANLLVPMSSSQPQTSLNGGGRPDTAVPPPRAISPTSDDARTEDNRPLSSNSIEAIPMPFDPIVAAVLVLGLGSGAVIGTVAVRPESWLGRWFAKIFSSFALTRLFSRTTGPAVLKHPLRSQIHDVISKEPGITISVLVTVMGVNRSTLRNHLRTLEREELIRSHSRAKTCHYYLMGQMTLGSEVKVRDPLFYRHRSKLANAVLEQPGQMQKELAETVGLPRSRVCKYIRILVESDLIEARRDGRFRRYFPTTTLRKLDQTNPCPM